MDKHKAASDIISHALRHAVFDGWNQSVLQKAALEAGYKKTDAIRVFPGGAVDAVDFLNAMYDEKMLEALSAYNLETMKIRERIALCVRLRLELLAPHREALRRAVALFSLPMHLPRATRNLYRTVDAMWYAAGDKSTDFNFYTKRALLAGVFSSTLLHWLDDKSSAFESSWSFLDRRIADVMKIEKAKHSLRQWVESKRRSYSL